MDSGEELARVRALSDGDLLSSLNGSLRASRRSVAEVVAHLGEVEERRLHWLAGYPSLFEYCLARLGMSEDEAYRRIEVARLARQVPQLFGMLASGGISLSVATLLRPHLTTRNCEALLADVSGKTVRQAREVLAHWFPRADVPSSIRKLPARREPVAQSVAQMDLRSGVEPAFTASVQTTRVLRSQSGGAPVAPPHAVVKPGPEAAQSVAAAPFTGTSLATGMPPPARAPALASALPPEGATRAGRETLPARVARSSIQPLSPERYLVQFSASTELKRKLELARDLLRHAVPGGDLAVIVERALDVLLEKTMKRRFGIEKRATVADPLPSKPREPAVGGASMGAPTADAAQSVGTSSKEKCPSTRHIPNDVKCAVAARDGGCCSWRAPDGTRCNSRAWLEHDHIIPKGQGGSSDAGNVRQYCRSHNRLAAEQAYGQATITRIISRRRTAAAMARRPAGDASGVPPPRCSAPPCNSK